MLVGTQVGYSLFYFCSTREHRSDLSITAERNFPALKINRGDKLSKLFGLENKQLVGNVLFPK